METNTLEASTLLDVRQVAATLRCSPRTTRRLADSGRLPAPVKLGSLVRWRRSDIEAWINDRCPQAVQDGEGER